MQVTLIDDKKPDSSSVAIDDLFPEVASVSDPHRFMDMSRDRMSSSPLLTRCCGTLKKVNLRLHARFFPSTTTMDAATDSQPPRKRSRISEIDESHASGLHGDSNPQVTRSTDYWFSDGSIVLQAEWTQFRVHRSTLALYSSVFRDMFEIPQPDNCEPMVDGCVLVHLPDSRDEITEMLASLYNR